MKKSRLAARAGAAILTLGTLLTTASIAHAAEDPSFVDLPAGQACPSFDVRLYFGPNRAEKVISDDGAGTVRAVTAGRGAAANIVNLATGTTFTTKATGAVQMATRYPDGSQRVTLTGNWIVVLFPTDFPAGPTTTLHTGSVTYTVDPAGNWTVQKVTGKTTDVCAALAG